MIALASDVVSGKSVCERSILLKPSLPRKQADKIHLKEST